MKDTYILRNSKNLFCREIEQNLIFNTRVFTAAFFIIVKCISNEQNFNGELIYLLYNHKTDDIYILINMVNCPLLSIAKKKKKK